MPRTRTSNAVRTPPAAGGSLPTKEQVFEIDTGEAKLVPDGNRGITLFVNGVPSSFIDTNDPRFLAFEYMQQMDTIVMHLKPGPIRALHLGAAGCALAWAWALENQKSRQIAVDIDGKLVELVRTWFDLPRAPALRIRAQDALAAIEQAKPASWDVIVRDVFAGDTTPESLATPEFVASVYDRLKPGGIYLANCADKPPLRKARTELKTLVAQFGIEQVAVIAEKGILAGKRYGNLVLVAIKPIAPDESDSAAPMTLENPALARALRSLPVPADIIASDELAQFLKISR